MMVRQKLFSFIFPFDSWVILMQFHCLRKYGYTNWFIFILKKTKSLYVTASVFCDFVKFKLCLVKKIYIYIYIHPHTHILIRFFSGTFFKPSSSLKTFAYLHILLGTAFQSIYPTCTENRFSPS